MKPDNPGDWERVIRIVRVEGPSTIQQISRWLKGDLKIGALDVLLRQMVRGKILVVEVHNDGPREVEYYSLGY